MPAPLERACVCLRVLGADPGLAATGCHEKATPPEGAPAMDAGTRFLAELRTAWDERAAALRTVTPTGRVGSSRSRTGNPELFPNIPAPSPGAAAAIAYARAQLGKPYRYATAGPDTFDCSGLTMAAWGSQGTRLPHYAASQAMMFSKVAYGDLEPGDLVFFYADLHHVGIYIGGGMMIHAPQTGDVVKISSAWRSTFQWGVRPR